MAGVQRVKQVALRLGRGSAQATGNRRLVVALGLVVAVGVTACTPPSQVPVPPSSASAASPSSGGANPVTSPPTALSDLATPAKKELAMELVSSAENSSLDWKAQFNYIEDIGDGRGYTGGIIGFCSGTGDMLELVAGYMAARPHNALTRFLPALKRVNGTASHRGLGAPFVRAWRIAAKDHAFQRAQESERDRVYFDPAVASARQDGLRALGQFAYYDAMVMHGPGDDHASFGGIRAEALRHARPPAGGGDEVAYLNAFLDARVAAMKVEEAHEDVSRVEDAQRVFLRKGNLDLEPPLAWKVYTDSYRIG